MLTIVKDSIRSALVETYDFKELRFEDETDEVYYYEGVDFIGNHVWVKVIIDDEVSLWEWDVYEQFDESYKWEYLGTVSCEEG